MSRTRTQFLVLAIDIGTSSTRTALFDGSGHRLGKTTAAENYNVSYGPDGRAELAPATLLRAAKRAHRQTLRAHAALRGLQKPIPIIGGSAFWHGLLGLDRKLKPITPVYTWADWRSATSARTLREQFDERSILQRTGCMLRAPHWPAKLRWLRKTQPKFFRQIARWVSPSDYIFHGLFGGRLTTSASMASGTGLLNLATRQWDDELIEACGIRRESLPEIRDRLTTGNPGKPIPAVFCPIGDGAAGNLGSGADQPGMVAINIGTSAAVRTIEIDRSNKPPLPYGLFRYVVDSSTTILGGAISNAGNLRQWCLHTLRLTDDPAELEKVLTRKPAAIDSLTVLPFWVEERGPSWPEGQLGLIDGITQAATADQIARSCATATFYRLAQIVEAMEGSLGRRGKRLIVSGGVLKSPASLKLLADALGCDLEISIEPEASLRGAAVHALMQSGMKVPRLRSGRKVSHNPKLALLHRKRRERQVMLESRMTQADRPLRGRC